MDIVADGGEPKNVFRTSALNTLVHVPQEGWSRLGHNADIDEIARYGSHLRDAIADIIQHSKNTSGLTA